MLIKDKLIEPYYVKVEDNQYILCLETEIKSGVHAGKKGEQTIGYYSLLSSLLIGLIKRKLYDDNKEKVLSIKKYIEEYEKMFNDFISVIKI